MLGDYVRRALRGGAAATPSTRPGYFSTRVSPLLQTLTKAACIHPLRTIVFVLVLASTSYIGLLETSLWETQAVGPSEPGLIDLNYLKDGSRQLRLGQDTQWKWQIDSRTPDEIGPVRRRPSV